MAAPHEPDEVDQTLLPEASAHAPPGSRDAPLRPVERDPVDSDTPHHPAGSDVTIDVPVAPEPVTIDASVTFPSTAPTVPAGDTTGGLEATLLPSAGSVSGTAANSDVTGAYTADASATLVVPAGRTVASGGGSTGPLGSDTAPVSVSAGPAGRPAASPSATGTMVGRFALRALHASGGLGEVFTARDTELNREVAVKRIKSHYADDAGSRRRFLTEAELTARLDHPGVVPVFGLVNDVRGRPCYAMRFIRGETLKDEIDRYYGQGAKSSAAEKTERSADRAADPAPSAAVPAPAAVPRSVAFRHLLARFLATCQAIAYAHSRNIIHRDIKPANIMVGTFGETLVVDWGLAKSLDDGPDFDRVMRAQAESGFRHDPDATDMPSHMTMAGTAVGTPAYMAPEQAAGDIHQVGPRADIYALGATLFVILAGKAPFSGKTTAEVLDRVRRGAYEPAAAVNPECPKPLDAIARKAMALRQGDRYATALDLAADVERWLSDEPVSCYRDPFPARLARWGRRHPARVATGASLLLAGALAAGGIAWAVHLGELKTREEQKKTAAARDLAEEQKDQTIAALKTVTSQKEQITAQNAHITEQNAKITVARNAATGRYESAVNAFNVLVTDIDKKLADRMGTEDLRKTLLENAARGLTTLIEGGREGQYADRTLVAAYRQMGEVYQRLSDTKSAHKNFALAVEQARRVKREAETPTAAPGDRRAADRDLGRALDALAGVLVQAGQSDEALKAIDEAVGLFTALVTEQNDAEAQADLAAARARRSTILMQRGDTRGAIKDCAAALAARKALAPDKVAADATPTATERLRAYAASLDAMAGLQLRTGRAELLASGDPEVKDLNVGTEAALGSARAALAIRTALADAAPDHPDATRDRADAHARLGEVYSARGHATAAAAVYRAGAEQLEAVWKKYPDSAGTRAELALMYSRLADAQLRLGEIDGAVKNARAGKELAAALQTNDSAPARAALALTRERLGDALLAAGRTDEGTDEYAASANLRRELQAADRANAGAELDLARGLERLGDGRAAKRDLPGAIAAFTDCVELRRKAVSKDKESAGAKRDLAVGLYKLADAQCAAGRPRLAGAPATEATELFVQLAASDSGSAQAQRDIALAYGKWGQVATNGGHTTGALIVWQNSLDRCEKLARVDAGNAQAKEDEAAAWERLAAFYAALGNTERALAAARTAVERWSAVAGAGAHTKAGRRRLALAMIRCGDVNTEVRQFATADGWYVKAAEVAGDATDPLLAPVARAAERQRAYAQAVRAGVSNPAAVKTFDEDVRAAALQTVATLELRAGHPTSARSAAGLLAELVKPAAERATDEAKAAADAFTVARTFAKCAAVPRGGRNPNGDDPDLKVKQGDAQDAVAFLKVAIKAGFRDADALVAPEWDAVRKLNENFAGVLAELEKLVSEGK